MEVCRRVIRYRHGDIFNGYAFGDAHGGTIHTAEEKVERQFRKIVDDPFAFWWEMGDSVECITPNDPRWNYKTISPWLKEHQDNIAEIERNYYCDFVRKAVKAKLPHDKDSRCLGKIKGNHESQLQRHNAGDMQSNICNRLDIPNLGFSCLYHLAFERMHSGERHTFRFHITHGSGNAQTPGGRIQKLKKIMNQTTALYTIVAHMHDIHIQISPVLDSGHDLVLKGKQRIGVITGTYLRTYTQAIEPGYGEFRNYDPTSMGCVKFEINPREGLITPVPVYA